MTQTTIGVLLVSHVPELATGVQRLLQEVAQDVPLVVVGGTSSGEIGTSVDSIITAIEASSADSLLAFFDLGSAKMNLELAQELASKPITLYETAFVEGSYTAAALLQAGAPLAEIETQLASLIITK